MEHASVFGSFARGEGGSNSDIDLFLVMPDGYDDDPDRWQVQLQEVEDQVLAWTGNRLEVLVLDCHQLDRAAAQTEPVLASLRDEAVLLHGVDIASLLLAHAGR